MVYFQHTQTTPWPIFGLAVASVDWAQRWMCMRGHAALEQEILKRSTINNQ